MVTIYIWNNKARTGHASVDLVDDYVSFHPNLSNDKHIPRKQAIINNRNASINIIEIGKNRYTPLFSSYEEDIQSYGPYIDSVELDNLDRTAISTYMKNHFDHENPEYCLESCNCSTVVAKILLVGIHQDMANHSMFGRILTKLRHESFFGREDRHGRLVEQIFDDLESKFSILAEHARRSKGNGQAYLVSIIAALDFYKRAMLWTPGDVLHLARQIQHHT